MILLFIISSLIVPTLILVIVKTLINSKKSMLYLQYCSPLLWVVISFMYYASGVNSNLTLSSYYESMRSSMNQHLIIVNIIYFLSFLPFYLSTKIKWTQLCLTITTSVISLIYIYYILLVTAPGLEGAVLGIIGYIGLIIGAGINNSFLIYRMASSKN